MKMEEIIPIKGRVKITYFQFFVNMRFCTGQFCISTVVPIMLQNSTLPCILFLNILNFFSLAESAGIDYGR